MIKSSNDNRQWLIGISVFPRSLKIIFKPKMDWMGKEKSEIKE